MSTLGKWLSEDSPLAQILGRSRLVTFLFGCATLAGGALFRLLLDPILKDQVVFMFFVPALLAAAAAGGFLPGMGVALAGCACGLLILARHGLSLANEIDAGLFVALGASIALGGERFRKVRRRAVRLTERVLEREAYLRSVLSTVPDPMVVIDEEGLIRSFSRAAEKAFGWSASEIVGEPVSLLMPAPQRHDHDQYLARYAAYGQRRVIGVAREETAQKKDGTRFPVEIFIGEMDWAGRKYFIGFLHDITHRKNAETRLKTLQSELLHTSRLSAMGEMAAALAHELNQPLSAVSNYLQGARRLLDADKAGDRALEAIDKAASQALRAGEIIRRMRGFVSRGESPRVVESLAEMIDEAAGLALIGSKPRDLITRIEQDPALDRVLVDKIQIQQVLLNLIRNALEAMQDSKRPELTISVTPAAGMACVSVADTGAGIKPEIADRLFQPFVSSKGRRGMGMGLSVCRTIVEAHGGQIWAEPNPGGGTLFRFTVPLAQTPVAG